MPHAYSQNHDHNPGPDNYNRTFVIEVTLNSSFVLIEAVLGLMTQSLVLLADAGHNLSDVLDLLLAWDIHLFAKRPPPKDAITERSDMNHVHHLHIWAMSTTETAQRVHLVIPDTIQVISF